MAEKRNLLLPSLETNTSCSSQDQGSRIKESNIDNTILDNTVLVSNDIENETVSTSNDIQTEFAEFNRMVIIREARKKQGYSEKACKFLEKEIRRSTEKAYDNAWMIWVKWCIEKQWNPREYDIKRLVNFFIEKDNYSYQHLNTIRSAIGSVYKHIYPREVKIAENNQNKEYFAAKKRSRVNIPKLTKLEIWDSDMIVKFILEKWERNGDLNLKDLQLKTIGLLCLATMARPRSDIGRLKKKDIKFRYKDSILESVIIHFRETKESQVKTAILGKIEEEGLCPVQTLWEFKERTEVLRKKLPEEHTLFLGYILDPEKVVSIRPATLANWVKQLMKKAGVPEDYPPHSIHAAASTKAVEKGNSIKEVKKHANWSLNTNTFYEDYYYKPTARSSSSTRINNSIFSTDKLITLEAEAE